MASLDLEFPAYVDSAPIPSIPTISPRHSLVSSASSSTSTTPSQSPTSPTFSFHFNRNSIPPSTSLAPQAPTSSMFDLPTLLNAPIAIAPEASAIASALLPLSARLRTVVSSVERVCRQSRRRRASEQETWEYLVYDGEASASCGAEMHVYSQENEDCDVRERSEWESKQK